MTRVIQGAGTIALATLLAVTGASRSPLLAQGADLRQDSATASVRCPERFTPMRDSTGGTLRCRRVEVRWVVTACADSAYASYQARPGADTCLPTSLPGVGSAPGLRGARAVVCAGSVAGYPIVRDRVGDRDRCEQEHTIFSPPLPVPRP